VRGQSTLVSGSNTRPSGGAALGDVPISDTREFEALCSRLGEVDRIAFDMEFVPERTYFPELCLLQIAAGDELVAVDLQAIMDLSPFWDAVLRPGCETVVHAGREELAACFTQTGRMPERAFDVQLAAGLVGLGYPLSYSALVRRLLDIRVRSAETRTDWRKRPLSKAQIRYALDDARHLPALCDELHGILSDMGREAWLTAETERMLSRIRSQENGVRWRKASGAGGLSRRELAVLRELAHWRDRQARESNRPLKHILRDDLLVELAKRRPRSGEELRGLRGMGRFRRDWERNVLSAVEAGLDAPESELPEPNQRNNQSERSAIQKILAIAMSQLASSQKITTELLGTSEDIRRFVEWYADGQPAEGAPLLASGWRADVCGSRLTDLLEGRLLLGVRRGTAGLEASFVEAAEAQT